jgi:Ser/Thr protein kinase RdoA (MazF antagonist)
VRALVVHNDVVRTNVFIDDTLALAGISDFWDITAPA